MIIQIRLTSLPDVGSPARVAQSALQGYYPGAAGANLVYIDVPYNIECIEDVVRHRTELDKAMNSLAR